MLTMQNITALRMERQHLTHCVTDQAAYDALYRDTSPGQNVYWNGFGDPPSITFRADFDDKEYNRQRQKSRTLIKGRFQGGNLGWIERDDLELFAGLALKPLDRPTPAQSTLLELIEREGPMNIAQMKETTGMLVKEITPVLHRLQEAFLIYEDQYDGEWDRGWYAFADMFPDVDIRRHTRHDALCVLLRRFAHRHVWFDADRVKSFYKVPAKDVKPAIAALVERGTLVPYDNGYILKDDVALLEQNEYSTPPSVYVMHRNDCLVKANDHWLKVKYKQDEHDILQYILIDGVFAGAVIGKFKNGPFIIEDIVLDISDDAKQDRQSEIIAAVYRMNSSEHSPIQRYCGVPLQ